MEQPPFSPPPYGPELLLTGGEREILESFLDFYRKVVMSKAYGVPDADARRRLVPSRTTLAGLLCHLTVVERNWFQYVLAGKRVAAPSADAGWEIGDATVAELISAYAEEINRSRATAARYPLDHVTNHPELGPTSLRWIYVHLIDETARHAGHADILRELTDGTTGVF